VTKMFTAKSHANAEGKTAPRRGLFARLGRSSKPEAEQTETVVPEKRKARTLDDLLERAQFPLKNRQQLMEALGGKGAKIMVKGRPPLDAEEAAGLCFSEKRTFKNPGEVKAALYGSSWTRTITRGLQFAPLPLKGPAEVSKRVGDVDIDGVTVRQLAPHLKYPIPTIPDLLESLGRARNSREG